MVADEVTLLTRRAGESQGTRWESTGEGTLHDRDRSTTRRRAPSVTLHLKPADDEDQLHDYTSDVEDPGDRQAVLGLHHLAHPDGRSERADGDGGRRRHAELETLNSMKALWARPRDEVTDDEYHEFYRHISHDWTDPLETIRMQAEGTFEYQALLFIPSRAPHDLFTQAAQARRAAVRQARVHHGRLRGADAGVPALRQGRGRRAGPVAQRVPRDPAAGPADPADPPPPGEEGAVDGQGHDDRRTRSGTPRSGRSSAASSRRACSTTPRTATPSSAIASFASTHDEAEPTTLAQYVERMKEGQEHIYYMTGESRHGHRELAAHGGVPGQGLSRCCCSPTRSTRCGSTRCREFDGKQLQSIAKGEVDLDTEEEKKEAEAEREKQQQEYADLLTWMTRAARASRSRRCGCPPGSPSSPACIVARHPRRDPGAGEHVPGDGPGGAARSSASSSSTRRTRWSPV